MLLESDHAVAAGGKEEDGVYDSAREENSNPSNADVMNAIKKVWKTHSRGWKTESQIK